MPRLQDILNLDSEQQIISALKEKDLPVPLWEGEKGLKMAYDPKFHPVMNHGSYPDVVLDGKIEPVTRIALGFQRLAAKRMSELVCGIPVKRVYKPENEKQKEIAGYLEKIMERNRIDSVNTDRCHRLFAGCEVLTLWYATEEKNRKYGFDSPLKLRCRTFSPMLGDTLYPLFDEWGDLLAMSVSYTRKNGRKDVQYLVAYMADRYIKWSDESGEWQRVEDTANPLGKIPAVYMWRPSPIWEDTSHTVYEMEWSLSRNGNYLRENSKPLFCVFADEAIAYGGEKSPNKEFRSVMQYPKGSTAQYVTWQQATESLKYHVDELRNLFFTELQLPDWSYEKMAQTAMSGESRKQLFIDAQLKVKDESGRLMEFFDREVNVVKEFLKVMLPSAYEADIDALPVETEITPFTINDDKDTITNLMSANGGLPLMSQRESIEMLGWSGDVEQTLKEIEEQEEAAAKRNEQDVFNIPPEDGDDEPQPHPASKKGEKKADKNANAKEGEE